MTTATNRVCDSTGSTFLAPAPPFLGDRRMGQEKRNRDSDGSGRAHAPNSSLTESTLCIERRCSRLNSSVRSGLSIRTVRASAVSPTKMRDVALLHLSFAASLDEHRIPFRHGTMRTDESKRARPVLPEASNRPRRRPHRDPARLPGQAGLGTLSTVPEQTERARRPSHGRCLAPAPSQGRLARRWSAVARDAAPPRRPRRSAASPASSAEPGRAQTGVVVEMPWRPPLSTARLMLRMASADKPARSEAALEVRPTSSSRASTRS